MLAFVLMVYDRWLTMRGFKSLVKKGHADVIALRSSQKGASVKTLLERKLKKVLNDVIKMANFIKLRLVHSRMF